MKRSRKDLQGKASKSLNVQFDEQPLTLFSGLVVFQRLFILIGLKEKLRRCFRHLTGNPTYKHHLVVLLLIVHRLLGFRNLRDIQYYHHDEMVKRTLGLNFLPNISTVSRRLASADPDSVHRLRGVNRCLVLDRLAREHCSRITLDFDGSVLSTKRHAEGTAVGFNKKKKGLRSYYPLFATIAQTHQVFDFHHRRGNVHDHNGAKAFIQQCLDRIRETLPLSRIESRMDSAFFSEALVKRLHRENVEFTISVPFERFTELKSMIETCKDWSRINDRLSFFEATWKPKSWSRFDRFIFVRKRVRRQHKEPIQLDLFIPHQHDYEFKVIVTNKTGRTARSVVAFHEGRGAQESIFAELKSQCHMETTPVKTKVGNQICLLATLLAHNLTRELQMIVHPPRRGTTAKRSPRWIFQKLATIRNKWLIRVGRLIRPENRSILSINADAKIEEEMRSYLDALQPI